jgi:uncharacterized membrane protein YdjX (TVP38/TMEM64 family)
MYHKRKKFIINTLFVVILLALSLSVFFEVPRELVEEHLSDNPFLIAGVYLALLIVTTVIAPFAGLPLAPVTSLAVGPFLTSILSIVGWTIGAMIAFIIARYIGKPILVRFVDIQKVERYERQIPERHVFLWLVFLRILIPVDVLSYAIGLASTVRFPVYILSTVIGVTPFSFIWVYGGHAILEKNYTILFIATILGLLLFSVAVYGYWRQRYKGK